MPDLELPVKVVSNAVYNLIKVILITHVGFKRLFYFKPFIKGWKRDHQ